MNLQDSRLHFDDPLEYFDFLEKIFEEISCKVEIIHRYYQIGPEVMQVSFAGPALISKLSPALEHLRLAGPVKPGFRICLWDSASTAAKMPPPPWSNEQYQVKGEIQGYTTEDIFTVYQHGPDALNIWSRHSQRGMYWVRSAEQVPYYESSAPLRTLIHLWAIDRGLQLVHAAAVGEPNAGVLIVGKGGLGKSTTAVSCLTSGLCYAGDDYVLLNSEPGPVAHSLYNSAKLGENSLKFFPGLEAQRVNSPRTPEEKSLFLFWPRYSSQTIAQMPLKAILIPRLQGRRDGSFERISPVECLKALAPSTLSQLPGATPSLFEKLCGYVKRLPAFYFHLNEVHEAPGAIRTLLGRL